MYCLKKNYHSHNLLLSLLAQKFLYLKTKERMATKRIQKIIKHLNKNTVNGISMIDTVNENPTKYHEKIAFKMYLNRGQIKEYKRRHDLIPSQWADLKILLTNVGIRDYSIFFDEENNLLFAVLWRRKDHKMDTLPDHEIMKKWWKYMAPLMRTNDNSD